MKKIIVNISDSTFEKLRLEAIIYEKSIAEIIYERIFYRKFDDEIENTYDKLLEKQLLKITKD